MAKKPQEVIINDEAKKIITTVLQKEVSKNPEAFNVLDFEFPVTDENIKKYKNFIIIVLNGEVYDNRDIIEVLKNEPMLADDVKQLRNYVDKLQEVIAQVKQVVVD